MNEFIIQIDSILKNLPMTRHNTAVDKELPEDLPQEMWATDRVWVRRGGHTPPLAPIYDGPYAVLQRSLCHFRLQMGDREDNVSTSRLKPCVGGAVMGGEGGGGSIFYFGRRETQDCPLTVILSLRGLGTEEE